MQHIAQKVKVKGLFMKISQSFFKVAFYLERQGFRSLEFFFLPELFMEKHMQALFIQKSVGDASIILFIYFSPFCEFKTL